MPGAARGLGGVVSAPRSCPSREKRPREALGAVRAAGRRSLKQWPNSPCTPAPWAFKGTLARVRARWLLAGGTEGLVPGGRSPRILWGWGRTGATEACGLEAREAVFVSCSGEIGARGGQPGRSRLGCGSRACVEPCAEAGGSPARVPARVPV